ncbi:MAG: hypothetical protein ACYC7D_07870 [Nitrososphaerales archaeon]
MKYVKLFVGFLIAGIVCILASFYIRTIKFEGGYACAALTGQLPTNIRLWLSACYHFLTALLLFRVGVALLIVALIIGLYGYFSDRKNVPAKLEPQPAQVNP